MNTEQNDPKCFNISWDLFNDLGESGKHVLLCFSEVCNQYVTLTPESFTQHKDRWGLKAIYEYSNNKYIKLEI